MAYTRNEDHGRYGEGRRSDMRGDDDRRLRDYERRGGSSEHRSYGSQRGDEARYEEWLRAGGERYAGEEGEDGWRTPEDYGASGVGGGSRSYDPFHSGLGYGRGQREGASSRRYGAGGSSYGSGRPGSGRHNEEYRGPYGQGDYGSEGYGYGRGGGPSRDYGSRSVSSGYSERAGGADSIYGTRYSASAGGYAGDYNRRYGADQGDGSYRGKGPKGYTRSDDRIKEEICDCLADDSRLDASDVSVEVKDGEVTLTGNVRDRESKRWAEDLVERSSGVKNVQNNLRVRSGDEQSGSGSSMSGSSGSTGSATGSTGAPASRGKGMQS